MSKVIVSRHPATVKFIARQLGGKVECSQVAAEAGELAIMQVVLYRWFDADSGTWSYSSNDGVQCEREVIPVITGNATEQDVKGKHVFGNIPLSLAYHALSTSCVEFDGTPPRGAEYTEEDMRKAGAFLSQPYLVRK